MTKIVINADADFTPAGKRAARLVTLRSAFGPVQRIRWYVAGKIFRTMPATPENATLSNAWLAA